MRRAWIDIVPEDTADGELEDAYKRAGSRDGSAIDNILAVHSLHPRTLIEHLDLYKTIMHRPSGLSRIEREAMAVVVSSLNECHYWIVHHADGLAREAAKESRQGLAEAIKADWREAPLSDREKALCAYAAKLTVEPHNMNEADLEPLRRVGLSDRDILDANLVASYFAFVNRIADGLGVQLER